MKENENGGKRFSSVEAATNENAFLDIFQQNQFYDFLKKIKSPQSTAFQN
jgi:hypothetical protein